jgi:HEAT repeat protein
VVEALGKIGDPSIVPELLRVLQDEDLWVGVYAARALAEARAASAVPELIERLKHPETQMRRAAARALGRIGDERAATPLITAWVGADYEEGKTIRKALVEMGPCAVPMLVGGLKHSESYVRRHSAEALRELKDPSAIVGLRDAVRDESESVRAASVRALSQIGGDAAVSALMEALRDSDPYVREQAIFALGRLRAPQGVPALAASLSDTVKQAYGKRRICDLASEALEHVGTVEALTAVEQWRMNQQMGGSSGK